MGPYGVHWDRSQTWWPMANGYHSYVSRCQYLLQQGSPVADILYLTPEGAPHVFLAPATALSGDEILPDRKGYNFDGCSPSQLMTASVKDHNIVFPSGASYRLLILPSTETMTPALLSKIASLVNEGASIVGNHPQKSPGLTNYPECDRQVEATAKALWGKSKATEHVTEHAWGKGKIYCGGELSNIRFPDLYPNYTATASLLKKMQIPEDFEASEAIRYTHHLLDFGDIYFVSNKTNTKVTATCAFRVNKGTPELWDPLTGETRPLPDFTLRDNRMQLPLSFEPYQSFFVVFNRNAKTEESKTPTKSNFPECKVLKVLDGSWNVSFDPKWGGPQNTIFTELEDWSKNTSEGIRYYSGIASYRQSVTIQENILTNKTTDVFLDLGEVHHLARVWVNGKDMGVVWTAPYRLKITNALISGKNQIEIVVANLWPNRLIGDEQFPDDGIKNGKWPEWLEKNQPRTSGRYTFTTAKFYKKDSELIKSGLLGPVQICIQSK